MHLKLACAGCALAAKLDASQFGLCANLVGIQFESGIRLAQREDGRVQEARRIKPLFIP
jgi:hypothetical protein